MHTRVIAHNDKGYLVKYYVGPCHVQAYAALADKRGLVVEMQGTEYLHIRQDATGKASAVFKVHNIMAGHVSV